MLLTKAVSLLLHPSDTKLICPSPPRFLHLLVLSFFFFHFSIWSMFFTFDGKSKVNVHQKLPVKFSADYLATCDAWLSLWFWNIFFFILISPWESCFFHSGAVDILLCLLLILLVLIFDFSRWMYAIKASLLYSSITIHHRHWIFFLQVKKNC